MAARGASSVRAPGNALVVALVAALGYAAFAHGAARQPGEAWLECGLAAIAVVAAMAALLDGPVRLHASRAAWCGVGLLVLFAAWCALSLGWSIAPDRTWEEANRAIAYALVAALGIAVGASVPRAVERFAIGWLAVAVLVALYALGGKVAPGIHVHPLFDLDQTAVVGRLRAPLEYWNALALVCVLAVAVAVRLAVDTTRSRNARLAALLAVYLFALVVGLTYSRGGILAYVVVAVVLTVLGGARLRGLLVLALAALAAVAPLGVAFTRVALKANGAPLELRIHDGRILGAVVVVLGALLVAAGLGLMAAERRVRWTPARDRLAWRALATLAVVLVVGFAGALAASQRGLGGSISHAAHSFTTTKENSQFDPIRLVSTNSGNRWVWWKEAAGAWSDRPVAGWGAGSFALLHKRYRSDQLPVTQAHSVPLQALAETGLVGLLLMYGGVLALLAAALGRLREETSVAGARVGGSPGQRELGVALLAGACAWLVHGLYDWDWNIPAVTAPALAMLGVLAGRPRERGPRPRADDPAAVLEGRPAGPSPALRALGAGAAALVAVAVIASAILPALADSRADAAAANAAQGDPAALQQAAAQAALAARLDPLATRPLFIGAAIAEGRGRLLDARTDLLEAADRQPRDPDVWLRLAGLALNLADRQGFEAAAARATALDPANPRILLLADRALSATAPPASSATAVGTPLPVAPAP